MNASKQENRETAFGRFRAILYLRRGESTRCLIQREGAQHLVVHDCVIRVTSSVSDRSVVHWRSYSIVRRNT